MTTARLFAIGLLLSTAGIPLGIEKGDGFDHLRLAALMGLLIGHFIALPLVLLLGIGIGSFQSRPGPQPFGYILGGISLVFGLVVISQSWATSSWLETEPEGVGDTSGEFAITMLTGLSGWIALLLGAGMVAHQMILDRYIKLMSVPVPDRFGGETPLAAILLTDEGAWRSHVRNI
ncbi:hypothetical protein [Sinosporangium siamense]|uniref:hypothetical protein n=1 Tax=Sinosporangium siamense TaxID=1367973 RepID=UPI00194EE329|nr:hypothetical protein [Sinosporangium siamense]